VNTPPGSQAKARERPWSLGEIRHAASRRTRRPLRKAKPPKPPKQPKRGRWRRGLLAVGTVILAGVVTGVMLTSPEEVTRTIERGIEEVTLPLRHEDIIRQQAKEKSVEADLIAAIIYAESRFRDQTSHAGARGLMQITPQTAEYIEKRSGGKTFSQEDLANPDINIRYGTFYLRDLIDRYKGNQLAAIAAYNAGPTAVDSWGGPDLDEDDIDFPETVEYVEDVNEKREEYRDNYGEELGL
jgi:soluble lytic murein transglycosylase